MKFRGRLMKNSYLRLADRNQHYARIINPMYGLSDGFIMDERII